MGLSQVRIGRLLGGTVAVSLYKVGDKWYVDIPTQRGRIRRAARTTDKKAAQEYHDRIKGELWRIEQLGEKPEVTWGEAVKKWLEIKPRGLPDKYSIRALAVASNIPLPLQESDVSKKLAGCSPASWNRYCALLSAIHRASGVNPPKIPKKPTPSGRTRWLTAEEWTRLHKALKTISPTLADAAEFAINTGLRENNVLNLEWSQVDLRRRVAWIHGDQAKAGQPIGIPLNEGAMAVLTHRRGIDKVFVFPCPDTGKPYHRASTESWYKALRKAKLYKTGVVWHSLRHTFASWAVMGGVRLEELMALGGWKSYSMVRRYAHLSPEHLATASAKVKPVSLRHRKPSNGRVTAE